MTNDPINDNQGYGGGARFPPGAVVPAVRLCGASTASGEGSGQAWWDADDSGRVEAAPVVLGWRREHAARRQHRPLRVLPSAE